MAPTMVNIRKPTRITQTSIVSDITQLCGFFSVFGCYICSLWNLKNHIFSVICCAYPQLIFFE